MIFSSHGEGFYWGSLKERGHLTKERTVW